MSSLTWQIGRKSTEQHGCYESRSVKLNFGDSPAHYTTVLHKYNSPAVFLREDTEEGTKLAKRIGGHLKTLQAISCISYILLYDWPSHLREQINRTFQFRNCHGRFFCSFWCIHGNNLGQFRSGESGYAQKRPCPRANAIYPWVKGLL